MCLSLVNLREGLSIADAFNVQRLLETAGIKSIITDDGYDGRERTGFQTIRIIKDDLSMAKQVLDGFRFLRKDAQV
jgi:hypothetical protein